MPITIESYAAMIDGSPYQTLQAFCLAIGWPALQEKAFWNSSMLVMVPMTRN